MLVLLMDSTLVTMEDAQDTSGSVAMAKEIIRSLDCIQCRGRGEGVGGSITSTNHPINLSPLMDIHKKEEAKSTDMQLELHKAHIRCGPSFVLKVKNKGTKGIFTQKDWPM